MTDHSADAAGTGDPGDEKDTRDGTGDEPEHEPRCSAKGCGAPAVWAVRWRNPKIHGPERRKIWLACDAHRDYLADFLGRRDFPRDVVPLDEID